MKKKNKVILWAAGITAVASVAGASIVAANQGPSEEKKNSGDGDCRVVADKIRDLDCSRGPKESPDDDFTDEKVKAAGSPWRYKVVNTVVDGRDEGLQVRICNLDDCDGPDSDTRIGILWQNRTVFVICKEDSGFNGGEPKAGTTWYKIKWPTNQPNRESDLESSREDRYSGWVFGKYMSPSGHDGKIAECEDLA